MKKQGLALIELITIMATFPIAVIIIIPNILTSKIAANESATTAILKTLCTSNDKPPVAGWDGSEWKPSDSDEPPEEPKESDAIILADFEGSLPKNFKATGVETKHETDEKEAAVEEGFLKVIVPKERKEMPSLRLELPEELDLSYYHSLSLYIKAAPKSEPWRFRFLALDEKERPIFQRVFTVDTGPVWTRLDLPFPLWRWGNNQLGDWSEVRTLSLEVENGEGEFFLDEIILFAGKNKGKSAFLSSNLLLLIAFQSKKPRFLMKDGFLIATDAVEKFSDEDLRKILDKVSPIRDWLKAVFKKSCRPFGKENPVSLLIFEQQSDFEQFYKRLGLIWRASIEPPKAGGYTVQDISASTYNEKIGVERPVYFHELVHAVIARELRIIVGHPRFSWLQEGIANYLQICLYPESIKRETYITNFSKPISKDGKTFFKPLEQLLTKPISINNYAQLASLIAFLLEKHPDYLDSIASNLVDGKEIPQILSELGTSFEKLEEEWMEWGKQAFSPNSKPSDGEERIFPVPEQWKAPTVPTQKEK
ncbi:MAG: hypothetical protein N2234_01075 [Planctomycetota bacterium]|nr:hypothetical protein [Planctomycetota bacterium]